MDALSCDDVLLAMAVAPCAALTAGEDHPEPKEPSPAGLDVTVVVELDEETDFGTGLLGCVAVVESPSLTSCGEYVRGASPKLVALRCSDAAATDGDDEDACGLAKNEADAWDASLFIEAEAAGSEETPGAG